MGKRGTDWNFSQTVRCEGARIGKGENPAAMSAQDHGIDSLWFVTGELRSGALVLTAVKTLLVPTATPEAVKAQRKLTMIP